MNADDSKDKFSVRKLLYDGACDVVDAEARHIWAWSGRKPQVGLALSGGGIRSATYCLGVLQALAHERALPNFDYLSTVSGGGYIGASLSYLLHQSASGTTGHGRHALPKFDVSKENFPYVSYPMVGGWPLLLKAARSQCRPERPTGQPLEAAAWGRRGGAETSRAN